MNYYIDTNKAILMKIDSKKIINRKYYYILILSIIVIITIIVSNKFNNAHSQVCLIFLFILVIVIICLIIRNNHIIDTFFDKVYNCPCLINISYNDGFVTIDNLYKNSKKICINNIKFLKHVRNITIIKSMNNNTYILPNISYFVEKKDINKKNLTKRLFTGIIFVLIIASILFIYDNIFNQEKHDETIKLKEKNFSVLDLNLYNNSASYTSNKLSENLFDMTDDWHSNNTTASTYNNTTSSWDNPNDNFLFFSNKLNGYTTCDYYIINNTNDFDEFIANNKISKIRNLLYFSLKDDDTKIFVVQIANIDKNGIYFFLINEFNEYVYYKIDSNILKELTIYIVHLN